MLTALDLATAIDDGETLFVSGAEWLREDAPRVPPGQALGGRCATSWRGHEHMVYRSPIERNERAWRSVPEGWPMRVRTMAIVGAGLLAGVTPVPAGGREAAGPTRSDSPPRKVVVATVMAHFTGALAARLRQAEAVITAAATEARRDHGRLDLVVLPEHAIQTEKRGRDTTAADKAVRLEGAVLDRMAAVARTHRTYLVLPLIREAGGRYTNSAALVDRAGALVGVYDKVHPVGRLGSDQLENGITPGRSFPVFAADFGKLAVQICWDMSYDDGFAAVAEGGAEIVALPSASPQTIRPAGFAERHRYWVVTATPRDNASIFSPAGQVWAQTTSAPILVQEIDLSFAVLHWQDGLDGGRALRQAYGDKVGYRYSTREDTGVFWSNDPAMPIGAMLKAQGLREMDVHVETDRALRERVVQ